MSRLTALEIAVLNEICDREPDQRAALKQQIATATVIQRENSGAGFFTHLSVDHSLPPTSDGNDVIGNVVAKIEGFEGPLLLLLFMKGGYADMLEGATVQDSTVGIDLSALRFKIEP